MTSALLKGFKLGKNLPDFYELLTAPAQKVGDADYPGRSPVRLARDCGKTADVRLPGAQVLNRWFESEPLKATLATDAVIGAMMSPKNPGSG